MECDLKELKIFKICLFKINVIFLIKILGKSRIIYIKNTNIDFNHHHYYFHFHYHCYHY